MEQSKTISVEQYLVMTREEAVAYGKTLSPEEYKVFGIAVHKEIVRRTSEAMVQSLNETVMRKHPQTK